MRVKSFRFDAARGVFLLAANLPEGDRALLRVAVVCNIPVACNRATADFVISSHLMNRVHQPWDPASERELNGLAAEITARP